MFIYKLEMSKLEREKNYSEPLMLRGIQPYVAL